MYDSLEDHDDVNNVLDWARRNDHQTLLHACFQAMLPPETAWSDLSVEAICQIDEWGGYAITLGDPMLSVCSRTFYDGEIERSKNMRQSTC